MYASAVHGSRVCVGGLVRGLVVSASGLLKRDMRRRLSAGSVAHGDGTGCCNEAWLRKEDRPGGDLKVQVSSLLLGDGH